MPAMSGTDTIINIIIAIMELQRNEQLKAEISEQILFTMRLYNPKLSNSCGRYEYRPHHPCHSEPFDRLRINSVKNLLGGADF